MIKKDCVVNSLDTGLEGSLRKGEFRSCWRSTWHTVVAYKYLVNSLSIAFALGSWQLWVASQKDADLLGLVWPPHSRVLRNSRRPGAGLLRAAPRTLRSHSRLRPRPRQPRTYEVHVPRNSAPGEGRGVEEPVRPLEDPARRQRTPSPTGPRARLRFPQFPLRFRRGGGASVDFRVWAWRCD